MQSRCQSEQAILISVDGGDQKTAGPSEGVRAGAEARPASGLLKTKGILRSGGRQAQVGDKYIFNDHFQLLNLMPPPPAAKIRPEA